MTDTTDIAALRDLLCHEDLESDYHVGVTVTTLRLLLSKADQLEAERQRAGELQAEQKQHDAQIEQMEGKIQLLTIGFRLKTKHCEKAEAELAALKGELANHVVLPTGYSARAGHPFNEGERNVMIPHKQGDWLSRFDVEHAIHVAGFPFTVKGE